MNSSSPDTVIVGAGAAGLLLAARLSEAGERVVVLESGPRRDLSQLISSQIWARRLKWPGPTVVESGNHKIEHTFNAGFGTGGSALHHYGVWLRLKRSDFSLNSDYALGLDWPIGYEELRSHYDLVQEEVGLSGDAKTEHWRPPGAPYPMPPMPIFTQSRILQRGFNRTGRHTAPLPLAINSRPYKGRPSCQFDGWCDAGCPIGALANPLITWLPRALNAGVEINNNAHVIKVHRDPSKNDVISRVEFLKNGKRDFLKARRFIISAFTVQSVRILLSSAEKGRPAPGDHAGNLGRYLTTHPCGEIFGLFEDETYPHQGVSGGQLLCHDDYEDKASPGGFGSSQWMIGNSIKPNDLLGYGTSRPDISGEKLQAWLKNAARHTGKMTLVLEDIPSRDNRITLSGRTDKNGIPLAHAHHDLDDRVAMRWSQRMSEGQEIFEAADATEVWASARHAQHIMGGTVMGDDPNQAVTDSFGRLHDMENLYVSGPSLFPSTGAVNPTFTISALASRQADHFLGQVASRSKTK